YHELNQLDSAKFYLTAAYIASKRSNGKAFSAYVLGILGDLLVDMDEEKDALSYLNQSLSLWISLNNKQRVGELYSVLSKAYSRINKVDSALYFAKRSLEVGKESPDSL